MPYGTLSAANAYHLARGNAAWAAAEETARTAALQRGSDYVDRAFQHRWPGEKTGGRAQVEQWPRTGAVDYDLNPIPSGVVPVEVEHATYEAALRELTAPGTLLPDVTPSQVKVLTKVGDISWTALGKGGAEDALPVVAQVEMTLRGVLLPKPGTGVMLA